MRLETVPTPAAVLDRTKFRFNCAKMIERASVAGVMLRPHMKTLKSIEAARMAIDPRHGGIAVSTLREAEVFANAGFTDIQIAVCVPPQKLASAAQIGQKAKRLSFFVDSISSAEAVVKFARENQCRLRVWLEIDCGEHRTGVAVTDPVLLKIAQILTSEHKVAFEGVATHAGHSYSTADAQALRAIAESERKAVVEAAALIRQERIPVEGVSAGSTPTAVHGQSREGLTELRAGVYMAGDMFQATLGSLEEVEIALSVLATVISHNRTHNEIVIDAGGLALSKDRSTAAFPSHDVGYGLIVDVRGDPSFGKLFISEVYQEHGEIRGAEPLPFDQLPIGSKVRVIPNHACMTAAAFDRYLILENDDVVEEWPRINGW